MKTFITLFSIVFLFTISPRISFAQVNSPTIQTEDETTATWVDFAYKKIHSFDYTKPDSHQERKLQKSKLLPRTKENMHAFMMLLTTEQIEAIGY